MPILFFFIPKHENILWGTIKVAGGVVGITATNNLKGLTTLAAWLP